MTTNTIGVPRQVPAGRRPRRLTRHALTALRILLVVEFAGAGLMKLVGVESMVALFADIGAGQWFRYVVGTLELAGAAGLLVPRLAGPAALGLTGLMTGALLTHAVVLGGAPILEAVFLAATATITSARRAELRSLTGLLRRG